MSVHPADSRLHLTFTFPLSSARDRPSVGGNPAAIEWMSLGRVVSSWQNMNMAQKERLRVRGWVAVLLLHHRVSLLLSAFDMTSTCVDKGPLSLGTQVPRAFIYLDAIVHCPA